MKAQRRLLPTALIALTLVTGCALVTEVKGPSGRTNYSIKCGSDMIEKCYQKAAELCPRGYDMVDRMGGGGPGVVTRVGTTYFAAQGPNNMLIECKS